MSGDPFEVDFHGRIIWRGRPIGTLYESEPPLTVEAVRRQLETNWAAEIDKAVDAVEVEECDCDDYELAELRRAASRLCREASKSVEYSDWPELQKLVDYVESLT